MTKPCNPAKQLVTSGGDRVFPKGLPIGTVSKVSVGRNLFFDIKVKPAADLDRLEEVLVITEQKPRAPEESGQEAVRASDILAEHLPGVPAPPPAGRAATGLACRACGAQADASDRRSSEAEACRADTRQLRPPAPNTPSPSPPPVKGRVRNESHAVSAIPRASRWRCIASPGWSRWACPC